MTLANRLKYHANTIGHYLGAFPYVSFILTLSLAAFMTNWYMNAQRWKSNESIYPSSLIHICNVQGPVQPISSLCPITTIVTLPRDAGLDGWCLASQQWRIWHSTMPYNRSYYHGLQSEFRRAHFPIIQTLMLAVFFVLCCWLSIKPLFQCLSVSKLCSVIL